MAEIALGEHILRIVAQDFHLLRSGWSAQVNVWMDKAILAYDSFNLSKQEDRTKLARSAHMHFKNGLGDAYELEDMKHDLDVFCKLAPPKWEESPEVRGQPVVRITPVGLMDAPRWLLKPLVHFGQPTLLFADGGSGKSVLGELIATIVGTAWRDNPLRLDVQAQAVPTLYLDWETDEAELQWRLAAMKKGAGGMTENAGFMYRACSRPLADDVDRVSRIVKEHNIGFIVVDSLGGAVGGDLKENDSANKYFSALRSLKCASLTMTHVTKESRDKRGASPFGSAYFWNWARSVWELQKGQEPGEDVLHVALHHRKANNTRLQRPMAYRMEFTNEDDLLREIDIRRVAIEDVPELSKGLSIPKRVLLLLETGARQVTAMADELDASETSVRQAVSRLRRAGKIVRVGDAWGLVAGDLPF